MSTKNQKYWIPLVASFVIAYMSWFSPSHRMPLDYAAMISRSIPLAVAWTLICTFSLWRYKRRGLWVLIGGPVALYWPIWLLFNHFPRCYYLSNCA